MKEHEAYLLAGQRAANWPERLGVQATCAPSHAGRSAGYTVVLTLPACYNYRKLRLARQTELDGILDVCSALLDSEDAIIAAEPEPPPAPAKENTRKRRRELSPEEIEAIRTGFGGVYVPRQRGRRKRGEEKPNVSALARQYHVGKARIIAILQHTGVTQE